MQVRSEQEALFLACEMERSAIQLYTRALMLMKQLGRAHEPLYARIQEMLQDEQGHLHRFESLYQGLDGTVEQQLMLAAAGEGVLFEGGLMGAVRRGLLKDVDSMLRLAMDAERTSIAKYRAFAQSAQSEQAREALLLIADEESGHLLELQAAVGLSKES